MEERNNLIYYCPDEINYNQFKYILPIDVNCIDGVIIKIIDMHKKLVLLTNRGKVYHVDDKHNVVDVTRSTTLCLSC